MIDDDQAATAVNILLQWIRDLRENGQITTQTKLAERLRDKLGIPGEATGNHLAGALRALIELANAGA